MQGVVYTRAAYGQPGLQPFLMETTLAERPDYVVFNGAVGALTGENALKADVGDTVRIFFGVGGPNLTSSFHVIGEIFDRVYPEGALNNPHFNVQTTLVPSGGAVMVEFKIDVPGTYLMVDHSLGRLFKGAIGEIVATGPENPEKGRKLIFQITKHLPWCVTFSGIRIPENVTPREILAVRFGHRAPGLDCRPRCNEVLAGIEFPGRIQFESRGFMSD